VKLKNKNCFRFGLDLLDCKKIGVNGRVALPLFGQVLKSENRRDRADRDARAAIDAFDGIDIELRNAIEAGFVLARVDAVYGAYVHARGILCARAWFGDYISHSKSPLVQNLRLQQERPLIVR
jgi:hypothetical protein